MVFAGEPDDDDADSVVWQPEDDSSTVQVSSSSEGEDSVSCSPVGVWRSPELGLPLPSSDTPETGSWFTLEPTPMRSGCSRIVEGYETSSSCASRLLVLSYNDAGVLNVDQITGRTLRRPGRDMGESGA